MTPWRPGQPYNFETECFYIRTLTPDDVNEDYLGWWNDAEIQRGFGFPPRNWTMENALEHVRQFNNRDKFHFGIFIKGSNELIGFYTAFYEPDLGIAIPNICIGNKAYWGKKTGTEVGLAFFDFGFNVLGARKAEGRVKGDNPASIALLKLSGFKKEGQLRGRAKGADGAWVDLHIYGLFREEWLASKGS